MKGKLIICSGPSGSGKTTLVHHLLHSDLNLTFSVSATSRKPRSNEQHGVEYYFLSMEEFKTKIDKGEFVEWNEVYKGIYYGTLKEEVNSCLMKGNNVIFDLDVVGGLDLKSYYGNDALAVFIAPPSVKDLEKRLHKRGTDVQEFINERINRAELELSYCNKFDNVIVNDNLKDAKREIVKVVCNFLNR